MARIIVNEILFGRHAIGYLVALMRLLWSINDDSLKLNILLIKLESYECSYWIEKLTNQQFYIISLSVTSSIQNAKSNTKTGYLKNNCYKLPQSRKDHNGLEQMIKNTGPHLKCILFMSSYDWKHTFHNTALIGPMMNELWRSCFYIYYIELLHKVDKSKYCSFHFQILHSLVQH